MAVAVTEIDIVIAERDALAEALGAALERKIDDVKLIDVMRTRYGREARQWQANHDQRKSERDEAIAFAADKLAHMTPVASSIIERAAVAARKIIEDELIEEIAKFLDAHPSWLGEIAAGQIRRREFRKTVP